jgi:hypothetical protein
VNNDPANDSGTAGCGPAVAGAAALLALAGLGFWIGFFMLEPRNYLLVFAALPVSALFTVLGALLSSGNSDFLLAWPVDSGLWLAVAFVASRWVARKNPEPRTYGFVFVAVIGLALAYGLALSLLVEPVG